MKIDLLFVTCNRLHYAKLSLPALLADPKDEFCVTLWDNASTDGTREFLDSIDDPRIGQKVYSSNNVELHGAANEFFRRSSADLVGIIPDDILMTPGWTTPIAQAHAEVPELGLVGCWHLGAEFFDEARARHKIQTFGGHQVLRHPWTGGGAGLVKLQTVRQCGPIESSSTTAYWIRMAMSGYVNGYYFPLIHVEHMDYPWSSYFVYRDCIDKWFQTSWTAQHHHLRSLEDAKAWQRVNLGVVLDGPWEAKYYVGLRGKLRRGKDKLRRTLTGSRF